MKKVKKSELQKLFKIMEENNLSISNIIAFIQGKNEAQQILIRFPFTVDYSLTVEEMMERAKLVNSNITSANFPIPKELAGKKIKKMSELLHFNRLIISSNVIIEINERGCNSANIFEVLAFAAAYPELQKKFPIVALGSAWYDVNGHCFVPVLDFDNKKRKLSLSLFDFDWVNNCRFLSIYK